MATAGQEGCLQQPLANSVVNGDKNVEELTVLAASSPFSLSEGDMEEFFGALKRIARFGM